MGKGLCLLFLRAGQDNDQPYDDLSALSQLSAGGGDLPRWKGLGPRLHDIHHTFAVHVLQKWVSEGTDLAAMMPVLSTYMEHSRIHSTARYLRLTAEV